MKVEDALLPGINNAIKGKDLAVLYGCSIREITKNIEYERRSGAAICADVTGGYYIAADNTEMYCYIQCLRKRHEELGKTINAMINTFYNMPA